MNLKNELFLLTEFPHEVCLIENIKFVGNSSYYFDFISSRISNFSLIDV